MILWNGKPKHPGCRIKRNIQHSHTDIGYTRSQTEILAEHLRYIDYALDYRDATDNYPENAKFRWTCEASWPVDEFLLNQNSFLSVQIFRNQENNLRNLDG